MTNIHIHDRKMNEVAKAITPTETGSTASKWTTVRTKGETKRLKQAATATTISSEAPLKKTAPKASASVYSKAGVARLRHGMQGRIATKSPTNQLSDSSSPLHEPVNPTKAVEDRMIQAVGCRVRERSIQMKWHTDHTMNAHAAHTTRFLTDANG